MAAAMVAISTESRTDGLSGSLQWQTDGITAKVVPGSGPPPSSCDGSIDLSQGCTQPMLGVM